MKGKSVASNHEFAVFIKKEMDFAAKWFKDRSREELEPPKVKGMQKEGGPPGDIMNFLWRSMGDEDFFLIKFNDNEHDLLISNMNRLVRVKRSIEMLSHWSMLKFHKGFDEHEGKL